MDEPSNRLPVGSVGAVFLGCLLAQRPLHAFSLTVEPLPPAGHGDMIAVSSPFLLFLRNEVNHVFKAGPMQLCGVEIA